MPQSVIAVLPSSCDSDLICESLDRDGIAVHIVPSPEEALCLLASRVDSVILYDADTGQPWRDALPRFLAVRPGVQVQVVLLTESPTHQTWLDLFDCGGFDLVTRPFRPAELRAIVRCALDPPRFFNTSAT
jgi:DNA-binding response OmpR family regulator